MIYARLTYNTNNWESPSGPYGKSKNEKVHEFEFSFGFEEWLRNPNHYPTIINKEEYCYGYIEGIHKNYINADENRPLILFTINAVNKRRFIVGEIKQWKFVNSKESGDIVLKNQNRIEQMRNDVVIVSENMQEAIEKFDQHVNNENGLQLFNIKYKEMHYSYDENHPLQNNHPIYKLHRFWLHRNIQN